MPTAAHPAWPRVAVAAEHDLVAESVCLALAGQGVAARGVRWTRAPRHRPPGQQLATWRPHVGLLLRDLRFDGSLAAVRWLVGLHRVPWVVVGETEPVAVGAVLERGAVAAVVPPGISSARLAVLLAQVARGGTNPAHDLAGARAAWASSEPEHRTTMARLDLLTPRERTVLEQLAHGRSVTAIGAQLDTSVATVRSQVKSVLRKLDVRSQLAAVAVFTSIETPPVAPGRLGS